MGREFHRFFVIVFRQSIHLIPCIGNGNEQDVQYYYYDMHGNSLKKYDSIWEKPYKYYGKLKCIWC